VSSRLLETVRPEDRARVYRGPVVVRILGGHPGGVKGIREGRLAARGRQRTATGTPARSLSRAVSREPGAGTLAATVVLTEPTGADLWVIAELAGQRIRARAAAAAQLERGATVHLRIDAAGMTGGIIRAGHRGLPLKTRVLGSLATELPQVPGRGSGLALLIEGVA